MTRHFDQRTIERAAVFCGAPNAIPATNSKPRSRRRAAQSGAGANASRALIEAIDAARSIARNRA
jgi:hypothetical protein